MNLTSGYKVARHLAEAKETRAELLPSEREEKEEGKWNNSLTSRDRLCEDCSTCSGRLF